MDVGSQNMDSAKKKKKVASASAIFTALIESLGFSFWCFLLMSVCRELIPLLRMLSRRLEGYSQHKYLRTSRSKGEIHHQLVFLHYPVGIPSMENGHEVDGGTLQRKI